MSKAGRARAPLSPAALAARQLELDHQATAWLPALGVRKTQRMSASPFALLRGAAPVFYEILGSRPDLAAAGGPGEGWLVGDLHLENFGAYRPDALHVAKDEHPEARFDLNDFDDAVEGPWRLDLLRFSTSLLLAGRDLGAGGARSLALLDAALDGWSGAATGKGRPPPVPRCVARLVEKVAGRSREELLDARTVVAKGERRFERGERYRDLPRDVKSALPAAFAGYVAALDPRERPDTDSLAIVDAAFRVAGTGSLGHLRIAVLVAGKRGKNGGWIFDLKEQDEPSATVLLGAAGAGKLASAARVVTALKACLEAPPRMIAATTLGGKSLFGRRLAPQEDRLELAALDEGELEPLCRHLGALIGRAHKRGATSPAKAAWSRAEREALIHAAIEVAGIHEAMHLAYCRLVAK